jgi:hypothetical protein
MGLLGVTIGLDLLSAAMVFSLLGRHGHVSIIIWHQERKGNTSNWWLQETSN